MAHSTQYVFDVTVADIDRNAYADLQLQVAQHPSETLAYMVTRVLAYALEYEEGIAFPPGGLSTADDPAVWVRDLTGALRVWIEVGTPDARRLHKASKAADRVVIYCHKDPEAWLRSLLSERIYAPERVSIVLLDKAFVEALADKVDRRTEMSVTLTEGTLYIDIGGDSLSSPIERRAWPKAP